MNLLIAIALLALAVTAGELHGRWSKHRRTAADFAQLRQTIAAQQASLTAIPATEVEHRQLVAADHKRRYQAAIDRLTAYYLQQRRTVRHG